jgi:hypothetical protein
MLSFIGFLSENDKFNDILVKQRNSEGYHPALRDPVTKTIYSDGDIHADIFKNMPPEAQKNFEPYIVNKNFEGTTHAGFVDKSGKWLNRYQVSKQLKNLNGGKASAESLLRYFHQ